MDITLRKGNIKDAETLTKLQLSAFEGFFMASLGEGFLRTYFRAALKNPRTICFVAEGIAGKKLGFVIGVDHAKGYHKKLITANLFAFAAQGLKLVFINPKALIRLYRNITKTNVEGFTEDRQDYAEMELMGVLPSAQNMGIGRKLTSEFEHEAASRGVGRISLTTDYYDNENIVAAYKRWGFAVMYEFTAYPERRMYRFIKDVK